MGEKDEHTDHDVIFRITKKIPVSVLLAGIELEEAMC